MENTANSSVPDFKELNYTRPDLDKFTETVRNVRLRLMTAKTIEAADEALGEYEIAISSFDTQYALCQILHDLDTSNEYYNIEMEFFDEAGGLLLAKGNLYSTLKLYLDSTSAFSYLLISRDCECLALCQCLRLKRNNLHRVVIRVGHKVVIAQNHCHTIA